MFNQRSNSPHSINVYSEKGQLLLSITEENAANEIRVAIKTCEKTYVKILPLYQHYIELNIDDEKQTWLISSKGYVKRKDNNSRQLYKVKNPELLVKYFK